MGWSWGDSGGMTRLCCARMRSQNGLKIKSIDWIGNWYRYVTRCLAARHTHLIPSSGRVGLRRGGGGGGGCQKVSGSHNVVETLILVLLVQCLRCVSGECFRHPCQPNKAETRPCELPKSFERILRYWTKQPKICVQFEVCQMTKTTSKS